MSTSTTAPSSAPHASGGRLRGPRVPLLLALAVAAVAAITVALTPDAARTGELDPENPGRRGAQALARVLEQQGVEVVVARDDAGLQAAVSRLDAPSTTIVVTSPAALGRRTGAHLRDLLPAARAVLVDPGPGVLRLLDIDTDVTREQDAAPVAADCSRAPVAELTLEVDGRLGYDGPGCFGERPALVDVGPYTLLGAGEALSNDQILRADNAALALRLLGGRPRLVWYVPDVTEQGAADGVGLRSLLPPALVPSLVLALLALGALAVWRGRRLGPVVTEPLPVTVRAAESVHSLGRLYHRAGDRGHAAARLRAATRSRLERRLALPPGSPPDALRAAIRRTRPGASPALLDPALADLYSDVAPHDDHALVALATRLAALEREVGAP